MEHLDKWVLKTYKLFSHSLETARKSYRKLDFTQDNQVRTTCVVEYVSSKEVWEGSVIYWHWCRNKISQLTLRLELSLSIRQD